MRQPLRQTELWDAYYEETDPEVRKKLLSDGCKMEPDDGLNPLRRGLWALRYTDPKDAGHRVDRMLWQCVNLLCIYRMAGPRFLRERTRREVRDAMRSMGFFEAEACGEAGRGELYREFRNAARRYFSVSSNGKSYRKKLFGIVAMSSGECSRKLAEDAFLLSAGIAERFGLQEELEPFSRAVKDEFFTFAPDAQALWDKCASAHRKKRPAGADPDEG